MSRERFILLFITLFGQPLFGIDDTVSSLRVFLVAFDIPLVFKYNRHMDLGEL